MSLCLILVSLTFASGTAQAQASNALISAVASKPTRKPELLRELMKGHVMIIATWKSKDAKDISIQDFLRNGKSFIPIFSDKQHFENETKGSGFENKGVSIDANLLAALLKGTETLVLNPGSKTPIEIQASELKPLINAQRLPK